MKTRNTFSIAATVAVLLAIVALWSASHVGAFTLGGSNWRLGMVGITPTETARLNVASLAGEAGCPADPARVELGFVDANGNLMLPAVQRTIEPGHATFVDLNGADILPSELGRMEIRPMARIMGSRSNTWCGVVTIEVIDNFTHKTTLLGDGSLPLRFERE